MAVEQIAMAHYRRQVALARRIADRLTRLWSAVDPNAIPASWLAMIPRAFAEVAAGQLAAAMSADAYLADLLDEYDLPASGAGRVNARSLSGVASDGRTLEGLLFEPAINTLSVIGQGAPPVRALVAGRMNLDMIVRTQIADAGRVADGVALTAHRNLPGYVRLLNPPSCARCVILAGKRYRWNTGFQRHPRCDCRHVPSPEDVADDVRTDPRSYFDSLGRAEQDRVFTLAGAQAIRDGADMSQVVNARRGAAGLSAAAGRLTAAEKDMLRSGRSQGRLERRRIFGQDLFVTTEGTTTRGLAGVRLGARQTGRKTNGSRYRVARAPRLMPESIYEIAGSDRDEAIRLLRRHGYLTGEPSVRPAAVAPRIVVPKPVATPAPVPAKLTLKDRIATGERSSVLLSGGVNAKTELVTLNDGTKVVRKTARSREGVSARTQQDAEELAAKVITSLGVRAPQTHRASARVLYMEYVDGTVPTTLPRVRGTFRVAGNHYDSDDGRLIGLGDLLTENYDRNSGNWLIGADGRLCAIDHGFAFITMKDPGRAPVMPDQYFVEHYHKRYPHLKEWADNDLSPQDIVAARQRVQHLRSEFERLGHLDWYDNALARLHAIGQHAKGTRSRLTR